MIFQYDSIPCYAPGRAIRFAESDSSDSEDEKKNKSKSYSAVQDIDSFMKEAVSMAIHFAKKHLFVLHY